MSKLVILKPRVSEKSYGLSEQRNTYVFDVAGGANRQTATKAITAQYGVEVEKIRLASVPGKNRRGYGRRGRTMSKGRSSAIRKMYVTLKEGQSLSVFAAMEEPIKAEKGAK